MNEQKFLEYVSLGIKNIRKRKLRSWLTMIGIFIGIAAVVALISLGQGLQASINEQFSSLGADKIFVMPAGAVFGVGGVNALSEDDIDLIKKINGVSYASGYVFTSAKIEWANGKELWFYSVVGYPENKEDIDLITEGNYDLKDGRLFKKGEKYKAIVGYDYAYSSDFKKNIRLGDKILINGKEFEVIGVWDEVGNKIDDRTIMIPMDTAREVLNIPERIDSIIVRVSPGENPEVVADRIEEKLRRDRGQKPGEEDFAVQTLKEVAESFFVILGIVTAVLAGIAAISLLVGGVGIANTMFTTVLERTKEIGILKAIGARNSDVMTLFLIESGLLGLVGGIIGVVFGVFLAKGIAFVARSAGFEQLRAVFPPYLIIGALLFSLLVGMLSGVVPARQAARMKPADTLRYE